MNILLYFLPVVGALIGWLAAVLSLQLLFRPRLPFSIGFFSYQGIIPKHAAEITDELTIQLAKDLNFEEGLRTQLQSSAFKSDIEEAVSSRLDDVVIALRQQIPMGEVFLTGSLADRLKMHARDELMKMVPDLTQSLVARLSQGSDLQQLIKQQVIKLDQTKLESVVRRIVGNDLKWVTVAGGAVGFFIGLIYLIIVMNV